MKIIIVGAGITGLTAGIYARQSGIDARIIESHSIAGGNSTSWRRKGYLFEGGMHWLVGSNAWNSLHELWLEVGALQENNPIYNRDPFLTYEGTDGTIALFRNVKMLEQNLMSVSPKDEKAIKQLVKDIQKLSKLSIPVMDIKGVKAAKKRKIPFAMMLSMAGAMGTMKRLGGMSVGEYINQFTHEGIREILSMVVGTTEFSANTMIFTLAGLSALDSGYPKGGSLQMAQNMENTFLDAGGNITYNKRVQRINVENGKANGVWVDNEFLPADAVVVTQDIITAADKLFDKPLREPWIDEIRNNTVPLNCTFVSFGVEADLSHLPENVIFPLKESFTYCGHIYKSLAINHYAKFEGYAPKNGTAVTIILMDDAYDDWRKAKQNGTYEEKKKELAHIMIDRLAQILPETEGRVAVWDIATPLTYERYCDTWRGSWMSVMKSGENMHAYTGKSESIGKLYFAGQRIMKPGGLPVALMTGRNAIQYICKENNIIFQRDKYHM